ncbi:MAG: selenide, water dikinase SelD [Longimicrobiales bacterium]|nr:selenide, water dikinase SelD [Longimicrobiales bacterium]
MAELAQVLRYVFPAGDANALVDASTGDDAAVYLLEEKRALVVTTDFFTPIVDDPYDFGQIAAANALSDIYAMGAKPLFALNLLAFPRKQLDEGSLEQIIRGGAEKCREAGIPILGGHSIDDAEPKYGLVVIGEVDPGRMCTNDAARAGQQLVLTKAIGTGIIATAIKAGLADPHAIEAATHSMSALNRDAAEAMAGLGIRAATDVTGFGLLGHLRQMLRNSGVSARIDSRAVPLLPGASDLAQTERFPGGTQRNLADVKGDVLFPDGMPEARRLLLADAQTSGGLLMAVPPELLTELMARLKDAAPVAAVIGEIEEGPPGQIQIT